MQVIQLFIGTDQVELFKDESVTITDSIQNIKDIEKVFTTFSQSFNVPASKANNKIFKHYYKFDIVSGFDGRKKVDATIELNYLPFRSGKVKLEGVDLKNNKPDTYKITFFGSTVDLKDKLGDSKLSDLTLTAYDLNYDASTIETKLTTAESSSNHIIVPLITHSQRLFFDSGTDTADSGNLHDASANKGVKFNELKYAIRVNKIIEQIETDFGLTFSTDFFKNTSITEMDHLFMWLHRKSGAVEDLSGSTSNFETQVDGWTADTTERQIQITTTTLNIIGTESEFFTEFELDLVRSGSTSYDIEILKDGVSVFSETGITATAKEINAHTGDFDMGNGAYNVFITASSSITFSSIVWRITYDEPDEATITKDFSTGTFATSGSFTFNVSRQIPDIKIIDFLTGLFKLFNLTAFEDSGTIKVQTLDAFYTSTNTFDITEFVDIKNSKVDVALPYRELIFKFKDTKTFLANKFGELNNRHWGEFRFTGDTEIAGQLYKVEAPFGHMLFEKLNDVNGGTPKDIQIGYNVDSNQQPYLGEPLLFYPLLVNTGGISFVDIVNSDNVASSHKQITNVNLPFNSPSNNSGTNTSQLNFNREQSEWTGNNSFTNDLFTEFYLSYINSIFNTKQRLTKLKAYLPQRILLNFGLGDRFIISGNKYKINSISTNLLTGESNLELINDL